MTTYMILDDEHLGKLEDKVCQYLRLGWEPQGGVVVTLLSGDEKNRHMLYTQAVIIKEVEK